jgi:hypothetical protein
MSAEIGAVIFCDDVRREQNGKDILIGVYSGDILIANFPFTLVLALWVEYLPTALGEQEANFRISYDHKKIADLRVKVDVLERGPMGIPMTGLPLAGEKEGTLQLEFSSDGQKWRLIKERRIRTSPGVIPGSFAPAPPPTSS